ncbi:MAG: hypothetical protein QOK32_1255 [Gaiellaceae bacterium]|nr:hypothetical protein [Gaiellaceae bacterium]MDX6518219.1 hypothetical protein [Gaiellaceae bacterium]MDX6543652.1 hypothetical protein [Gaiellaceae bacterium]
MRPPGRQPFPLVPRWRVTGLSFGEQRSVRRGPGSDVAGSRPYQPGDPVSAIDWYASARLSSAHGREEFVVREHYEDEAPRVVLLCDRRPSMSLYDSSLPWLSKPAALAAVAEAVILSALVARGEVGYFDESGAEACWLAPRSGRRRWELTDRIATVTAFDAPEDTLARGFAHLLRVRADLPGGSFVFVLSDFLSPPDPAIWVRVMALRWDIVPVVIQDPVWEQSFPELPSVVVPFADPRTGRLVEARLSAAEARDRRAANERRLRSTLGELVGMGLDPIVIGTSDPVAIDRELLSWAELRKKARRRTR